MDNIYIASGTTAIVVSVILQIVKNSELFPFLSRNTGKLNSAVSFLIAFLSSIGLVASFDFNQASGDFTGQFHGNLWDLLHVTQHTVIQWAAQHGFYKAAIVPAETLGEIRALLSRDLPPPVSEGMAKAEATREPGQPAA